MQVTNEHAAKIYSLMKELAEWQIKMVQREL